MNQGEAMQQPFQTPIAWSQTLIGVSLLWVTIGASEKAISAEVPPSVTAHLSTQAALQPSLEPLNLSQAQQGRCGASSTLGVTDQSISQYNLTVPSFWWTRDQISAQPQFGSKLLDSWLACPGQTDGASRVDFIVNQQVWSLLDYLDRYGVVQQLGKVARGFSYNTRIFNRQGGLLAAYTCNFASNNGVATRELTDRQRGVKVASADLSNPSPLASAIVCNLALDSGGRAGLRGRPSPLDGLSPRGSGTIQP
ncbi:hypothetical protein C7B65_10460 [Phormidesmis priestleyi ULC007]|uniref:Uncharacterized protein n=1 Tax=Phormidesmis priestleyi ULC007 TaxID=1920490 RepID=A0A2T1DGV4_9CYAN|nr:hypothetical protein [Phormidesmis priestleyi]PSB19706.1 hypothetical protein C7B65_10460 [Phormidesmis priestleyi ULC007]PZO53590.1 MAG: hypothetical protein DCF14_04165 [Phormidesmis priestleyi]